jgi:GT2 family glycosyltransferase
VILKNDVLSVAFNFMESNTNVGVCTAQNFDEHNNFVPSFDHDKGLLKLIFGRSFLEAINTKKYPKRKQQHKAPLEVNFVNGAFMFFRKSTFEKVNGFDQNIFLYFEEMDICYRIRKQGLKCVLLPQAEIVHFQGASTGISTALKKEGFISYLYILKKNYSTPKYLAVVLYLVITFLIKPKKWDLLHLAIKGGSLSSSLKNSQLERKIKR